MTRSLGLTATYLYTYYFALFIHCTYRTRHARNEMYSHVFLPSSLPPSLPPTHLQELWLVVDEKNKAARGLYEKNGYELIARDPRGMKVVPTEWQLKEVLVTNLCMRKDLRKGGRGGGGGGARLGGFLGGLFGGR